MRFGGRRWIALADLRLQWRSMPVRDMRLWTGLALGLFLVMHYADIALGLISVGAMQASAPWLMGPWHSLPGTIALYGALLLHFVLTLRALYRRRTLRMGGREAAQIVFGLALPLLLASHVAAVRLVPALGGHHPDYEDVVRTLWMRSPSQGGQQAMALVIAWVHGCFGIWYWLRTKRWFPQGSATLLAGAVLLPILALLGFAEAGKAVAALPGEGSSASSTPDWLRAAIIAPFLQAALVASVAGVMVARVARWWRHRHAAIRIAFPKDRAVSVPRGTSVLEASRMARIPHASACGGRGRCSTCRVRVTRGLDRQPEPTPQEASTLRRFGADRDVRLACQLRPTHDLAVLPIFPPTQKTLDVVRGNGAPVVSRERDVAILFCDLRGFTRRAEQWLPFDTVYILNRYFEMVGRAVEDAGGHLDKFIGDGALALFGLDVPFDVACGQAIHAATAIARSLHRLNRQMRSELSEPLRIAMGLHAGPAVVGEMGYGRTISLTAIGDGINVASRLEGAAKEFDVEAMISIDLATRAGLDITSLTQRSIVIRGRLAPVDAVAVERASMLVLAKTGVDPRPQA